MNSNAKYWFENFFLGALVIGLGAVYFGHSTKTADAAGGGWDTDGIMCVTANGNPAERVVLIDTKKRNVCVYNIRNTGEVNLVTARNYEYDFLVKDETQLGKNRKELTYYQVRALFAKKAP